MKSVGSNLRKGFAIPIVMLIFIVVVTVSGILFTLFFNNVRVSIMQERNIQAYYCAMTGIEMGTAALFTVPDPLVASMTLMDYFKDLPLAVARDPLNPASNLMEIVMLPNGPDGTPMGSVQVTISAPVKPGALASELWIRVGAVGTHLDAVGNPFSVRVNVWYNANNPAFSEQEESQQIIV